MGNAYEPKEKSIAALQKVVKLSPDNIPFEADLARSYAIAEKNDPRFQNLLHRIGLSQ